MDVLTFGESMVLFTPEPNGSIEGTPTFLKHVAGAESNFSIGLARLGHDVSYISRFGDDGFGRYILKTLRGENVDVSHAVIDPSRPTAVFFKETSPVSGTNVLYYRRGSAASAFTDANLDFTLSRSPKVLHVTGITPALSQENRDVVLSALNRAKAAGIAVTFDPNVRLKLWSQDEAVATLREMAKFATIALPGMDEGYLITGQKTPEAIAEWFIDQGCELVVVKLGAKGAYFQQSGAWNPKRVASDSESTLKAFDSASSDGDSGYITGYKVKLVDEVGAGDAFAAGLVSGLLDCIGTPDAVRRACALGAIAVCGVGDYELAPTRAGLDAFLKSQAARAAGDDVESFGVSR